MPGTIFTAIMATLIFGLMAWIFRLTTEHVENRRLRLLVCCVLWCIYSYVSFLPLLIALFTGPIAFIVSVLKGRHFRLALAGTCAIICITALFLPKNDPALNLDAGAAMQNLTGTHDIQLDKAMKTIMDVARQRRP